MMDAWIETLLKEIEPLYEIRFSIIQGTDMRPSAIMVDQNKAPKDLTMLWGLPVIHADRFGLVYDKVSLEEKDL